MWIDRFLPFWMGWEWNRWINKAYLLCSKTLGREKDISRNPMALKNKGNWNLFFGFLVFCFFCYRRRSLYILLWSDTPRWTHFIKGFYWPSLFKQWGPAGQRRQERDRRDSIGATPLFTLNHEGGSLISATNLAYIACHCVVWFYVLYSVID